VTGDKSPKSETLLEVEDLEIAFSGMPVVDGVSFSVARREVVGIVGESGSGKSVTALAIMGLVPAPPGRIRRGSIRLGGEELIGLPESRMENIRGARMAMIFQEPMTALNPVLTVGHQLVETIRRHQKLGRRAARTHALEMLARVGIPAPGRRIDDYPHEMSGGMLQRVMIAMALSCHPELLIADEPTTALDVTIQAQILELLEELQAEMGMSVLLITHDLGVVAEFAHRVLVMYAGGLVETASTAAIFDDPRHPYTEGLLRSIPSVLEDRERLEIIEGVVPSPAAWPRGCRFAPRCGHARSACGRARPPLLPMAPGHEAACIRHIGYSLPDEAA